MSHGIKMDDAAFRATPTIISPRKADDCKAPVQTAMPGFWITIVTLKSPEFTLVNTGTGSED
jgi:hypothetical protein